MDGKVCCFIGHRKIEKSVELTQRVEETIRDLIKNKGVRTFLFGSRSEFDDLCHSIVTDLQKNNPQIILNDYGLGKLIVDVVPSILYRDNAAALAPGYDGNGLTAIASQREEECIELFVIRLDGFDNIFFFFLCINKIH